MKKLVILDSKIERFPSSSRILIRLYDFFMHFYLSLIYALFIIPWIKKEIKTGKIKVIAADFTTEARLKKSDIACLSLRDYIDKEEYKQYKQNAMNLIRAIPGKDSSFKKIVDYDGISMWEMNEVDVYGTFFEPIIINFEIINKIIKKEKPEEIIIMNSDSRWGILQKLIAEKEKIKSADRTNFISRVKENLTKILMPFIIKTIHSDFLKTIKRGNNNGRKPSEIVHYTVGRRGVIDNLPYLLKASKFNKVTIFQNEDTGFKDNNNVKFEKMGNYIDNKLKNNIKTFKNTAKIYWKKYKNSKKFRKNLDYRGVCLYALFEDMFDYLFSIGFLESVFYYEAFDNLVKKAKPRLFTVPDELSKPSRILVNYCAKNRINSLLIQHGLLSDEPYHNIPFKSTKYAVFGEDTKKLLQKFGLPSNRIIIAGNPRFDGIVNKKYDKNRIYSMLNIHPEKKIIVFASQLFPTAEEMYELSYNVILAMKNFSDCQLVIKLHPDDDFKLYEKLTRENGIKAVIVRDIDLYELLNACSLLISSVSTINLEAIMFNKFSIDINFTGAPDRTDYISSGAVLGVHKKEELVLAIKRALYDTKTREMLKKTMKKYVYEHAYKQDGKATERIVSLIRKMADSKV